MSKKDLNEAFVKVLDLDYKDTNSDELKYLIGWCEDRVKEGKYKDHNHAWVEYEGYPDSVLFMLTQMGLDVIEPLTELMEQRLKEEGEAGKERYEELLERERLTGCA